MKNLIIQTLLKLKMLSIKLFLWRPLINKTFHPHQIQNDLLKRILAKNKSTTFGQEHGFEQIHSYEEYRSKVPVCDYEALRSYIDKQESEGVPHLNASQPVMYVQTSGTTGEPKNIPILQSTINDYRNSQHIVAYAIYENIPGAYDGKILAITSPAVEGVMASGAQCGAMSGIIYRSMPSIMREKYVLPAKIFEIKDYDQKYYEMTKLALAEKNITMIATANPSTLIKLDQVMNHDPEKIIDSVSCINKERANELTQILRTHNKLTFSKVWPNVKCVTTWTGGNCGVLIPKLKKEMPTTTRFVELGYLSSEFRGGITFDVINNLQLPSLHENFFEFVEKNAWEDKTPTFLTLTEIQKGEQYYIFVTTKNGLYRYNINDLIEVTGQLNNTPTIQFVQKGKGVTNLTGEKLYEGQLIQAMTEIINEKQIHIGFFKMLGCAQKREYTLYTESNELDIADVENRLAKLNIEFESKRKSTRLNPLRLVHLNDGTGEAYKRHCLQLGQRESQFKMSYLQYQNECSFDFKKHTKDN